ncbi:endopeptidase La [Megamonas funiformis]|uniref:Lon protease n=3 Tax=Megamonas funiformis TaxID=437897 RepID=A0ABN0ELU5_9FIRM|nr:endopeptidase La [Megamonas funiformis]EHR39237.1 ATP-dependent protease La [Megamonas funiformis YIT 11815]MCB6828757.1 endopeptidase La [Megamonas funiformis]QIB60612.1 endopeptidase La [Megamonas funiformis]RGJ98541.1 endopeptidase La [Megamonas funiformis]
MGKKSTLSFLPLRGMVLFPNNGAHIDIGRDKSVAALEECLAHGRQIMLSVQKDVEVEDPKREDVYEIGTVCQVQHVTKLNNGIMRAQIEGLYRARILDFRDDGLFIEVDVEEIEEDKTDTKEIQALIRACISKFEDWVKLSHKIPPEVMIAVNVAMDDGGILCNVVTNHLNCKYQDKQEILGIVDLKSRLEALYKLLLQEVEIMELENKIVFDVNKQMNKIQKEYYLREQIKAINKELGEDDEIAEAIEEYRQKMKEHTYPEYVTEALEKELKRLERTNPASPEMGVIQNYIEWVLDLPWDIENQETIDVKEAQKTLDKHHYGLTKVKERIIEYLSIKALSPDIKAPIVCLVGPPGVGKTSIATSIAQALKRKFVRASLGGVRDEAEIRGHRRTYVGAMPGRIIEGIKNAGSKDPLFLLDEVDKMASDYRGDPVSALLEVLDPEQNSTFSDHYIGLAFDLSKVMWIITANDLGNIPRPLRDRMEIIMLPSYTEVEKMHIAKEHLLDKVKKANGLKKSQVNMSDEVISKIIEDYTREAGVRELERQLSKACRKAAYKIVTEKKKSVRITKKNITDFLGKAKYTETKAEKENQVGLCTGLAWTEVGGVILPVEVAVLKGKGNLLLTGQLGDVMKESGRAALTCIRARSEKLKIDEKFYEENDIHVHFPEGAVPKDGPSAGITMTTAIVSALTGKKVRADVAMTGEITLRGKVLPIGGLKEKSLAAYREGIYTVIMPKANERDLDEIAPEVKAKMKFIPVETIDEVLKVALVD